ncbi:type III secretion system export apparatus subunit SctT [Trinickia caryophylli]|uniref:Type III secretion protein T n=1 Tax=Trinickia caryophylli TaxID=28094 RepID=A0A1X7D604_TRICW|nr:type III secretion system export apparatus subunit SctT [Trinickia caryophylli]PMS12693.1 EscT/YscT/HrcT family type III secretion system export apparatus protein [Trinickia caryophylli]TRX15099.1 EscT/YscT/HrcT family type III secretion system export apparatus protein [Trinickia caryophylli]WQE14957.1 type III secretion system export apparatus subunit SctT [Trinickia caryophylli]SMF09495.1 type III secretion protein T [Trinickia caryophylli]GLU31313.1 EscT/YscT/HrcT family type III secreti
MSEGFAVGHTLAALFSEYEGFFLTLALAGARVAVLFHILPATSDEMLPGVARNGLIYLIAFFVASSEPAHGIDTLGSAQMLMLAVKEMFLGAVLGFAASSVFWIAQCTGTMIDDLAGYNSVQMNNPMRGDQSTPISNTLMQLAVTLFYVAGGMTFLLGALFESFKWWPLTSITPSMSDVAESFVIARTDSIIGTAVKLAMPVMLALVLVDVSIGVLARTAEKLEPSSLSQPIRGAVGLLMLVFLVGVLAQQVTGALRLDSFMREAGTLHGAPGGATRR